MEIKPGDRVRYSPNWLRDTGQYYGATMAERGTVVTVNLKICIAIVDWGQGFVTEVLICNLERA